MNSRRFDPVGIIPLDANFSRQQLQRQTVGMGLFVFSEELPVYSAMVVQLRLGDGGGMGLEDLDVRPGTGARLGPGALPGHATGA